VPVRISFDSRAGPQAAYLPVACAESSTCFDYSVVDLQHMSEPMSLGVIDLRSYAAKRFERRVMTSISRPALSKAIQSTI